MEEGERGGRRGGCEENNCNQILGEMRQGRTQSFSQAVGPNYCYKNIFFLK